MEPSLVLRTCAVLLALAAIGGATMAVMTFGGKPRPPAWLAMLHGFLAAAAVTLLLYASATVGLSVVANAALVLFLVAPRAARTESRVPLEIAAAAEVARARARGHRRDSLSAAACCCVREQDRR
jgi:hypothetical protein